MGMFRATLICIARSVEVDMEIQPTMHELKYIAPVQTSFYWIAHTLLDNFTWKCFHLIQYLSVKECNLVGLRKSIIRILTNDIILYIFLLL